MFWNRGQSLQAIREGEEDNLRERERPHPWGVQEQNQAQGTGGEDQALRHRESLQTPENVGPQLGSNEGLLGHLVLGVLDDKWWSSFLQVASPASDRVGTNQDVWA